MSNKAYLNELSSLSREELVSLLEWQEEEEKKLERQTKKLSQELIEKIQAFTDVRDDPYDIYREGSRQQRKGWEGNYEHRLNDLHFQYKEAERETQDARERLEELRNKRKATDRILRERFGELQPQPTESSSDASEDNKQDKADRSVPSLETRPVELMAALTMLELLKYLEDNKLEKGIRHRSQLRRHWADRYDDGAAGENAMKAATRALHALTGSYPAWSDLGYEGWKDAFIKLKSEIRGQAERAKPEIKPYPKKQPIPR